MVPKNSFSTKSNICMKKLLEKYLPSDSFYYFDLFCLHFPGCCRPPNCTQICHEPQFIKHRQRAELLMSSCASTSPGSCFQNKKPRLRVGNGKCFTKGKAYNSPIPPIICCMTFDNLLNLSLSFLIGQMMMIIEPSIQNGCVHEITQCIKYSLV